ncbi:retromer subunit VPS17 KNAG_0B04080, partial [Huiozyma naganishii CBS 8797]
MASAVPYYSYEDDEEDNPFASAASNQNASVVINAATVVSEDSQADAAADTVDGSAVGGGSVGVVGSDLTVSSSSRTSEGEPPATQSLEDDTKLITEREQASKFKILVKVVALERTGSLSNKRENPTVVFHCSTTLPTFHKQQYKGVKKTMDEFRRYVAYLNKGITESFIPSLPKPYTNYGINNQEDYDKTVKNLQGWFDRVVRDPLILRNEELAFFVESDWNTYTPIKAVKNPPVSGLKRRTLKQLAPPYDQVAALAEFRPLVKSVYLASQALQERLVKINKCRRLLTQEESSMGANFIGLAEVSDDASVRRLYSRYGKVMTAVGDVGSILATMELATLYDGLDWVVADAYNIKESLTNRHFTMRELIQAQQNSKTRQESARKLRNKRDISPLKVDEALRNLKLATKTEQELTLKLRRTTANMLIERNQWVKWYESWMHQCVKEFVLKKIEYERKKLALLERVRSDVRNADSMGGLSRLGRDHKAISERVSDDVSFNSQSVDGDSWTGETRNRGKQEIDEIRRTAFDKELEEEGGEPRTGNAHNGLDVTDTTDPAKSLDARHAAS